MKPKLTNRMYPCKGCGSYAFPVSIPGDVAGSRNHGVSCFGCKNRIELVHHTLGEAGMAWNAIHKQVETIKEDVSHETNIEKKGLVEKFREGQENESDT